MIPGAFDYHRPQSVDEAVGLLASLGDDATVVAGGHSLIPMMKLRMAVPEHLVDLQDLEDLKGISVSGTDVTLGAMVTQNELIASDALAQACPIIRETALQIADPQIRYVGTVGGNVANGDPGNDMPGLMLALDATYALTGPDGTREVRARDFYDAAFFTARGDGEILTAIKITAPPEGHGWSYMKQKRKIGDYATAAAGSDHHHGRGNLCERLDRTDQRRRHAAVCRGSIGSACRQRSRRCRRGRGRRRRQGDHQSGGGRPRAGRVPHSCVRRHG